jgi:hypothetical protein
MSRAIPEEGERGLEIVRTKGEGALGGLNRSDMLSLGTEEEEEE